jgi:hypothetical protein
MNDESVRTFTTERVRKWVLDAAYTSLKPSIGEEFDRWLVEHDRAVAERAMFELHDDLLLRFNHTSPDFRGDPLPVALIHASLASVMDRQSVSTQSEETP